MPDEIEEPFLRTGQAAEVNVQALRTGQVAERAGVNIQTLRYYERRGLIAEPRRSPGGHRTYPPETVTLLRVIKAAQRLGFTLEEVSELLETGRRSHPAPDLQERAKRKLAELEAKIEDLHTIHDALSQVIAARCDSLTHCVCPDCPLPYAQLADQGGGGLLAGFGSVTQARLPK